MRTPSPPNTHSPPLTVCLLRGINVGRGKRISMDTLRQLFTRLGATEVKTYIQSGNIIYRAPTPITAAHISTAIAQHYALNVNVIQRTAAEFHALIASCPYTEMAQENGRAVHITMFDAEPAPHAVGPPHRARRR